MATLANSLTGRNLRRAGHGQIVLDGTRDVILIEGPIEIIDRRAVDAALAASAAAIGFEPRQSARGYVYIVVRPSTIRAWREENELAGREIMRDGR